MLVLHSFFGIFVIFFARSFNIEENIIYGNSHVNLTLLIKIIRKKITLVVFFGFFKMGKWKKLKGAE